MAGREREASELQRLPGLPSCDGLELNGDELFLRGWEAGIRAADPGLCSAASVGRAAKGNTLWLGSLPHVPHQTRNNQPIE